MSANRDVAFALQWGLNFSFTQLRIRCFSGTSALRIVKPASFSLARSGALSGSSYSFTNISGIVLLSLLM